MSVFGFHVCPDEVRLLVALLQQHGASTLEAARNLGRVLKMRASAGRARG